MQRPVSPVELSVMGLHDEREKLAQAAEWLRGMPVGSEHFTAAHDHAVHVARFAGDPLLRDEATKVVREYPARRNGR
jgi:hypothetical protein